MHAGEWVRGKTGPILARSWGVHPGTIDHEASEASRNIRRAVSDDDYRQICIDELEEITTEARGAENHAAAVSAVRTRLDARGLLSRKIEVGVTEVERMTDVEKVKCLLADRRLGPLLRAAVLEENNATAELHAAIPDSD